MHGETINVDLILIGKLEDGGNLGDGVLPKFIPNTQSASLWSGFHQFQQCNHYRTVVEYGNPYEPKNILTFWDVSRRPLVVSDVSGQGACHILKGQQTLV